MKVKAEILEQRHLDALIPRLQRRQRDVIPALRDVSAFGSVMRQAGPCAAFTANGDVIACAGLIDFPGTGRAVLWILFSDGITCLFAALIQKMRALMNFHPRRRYEAYIDPSWPQARRLAKIGGFDCEGLMKSFETDGSDRELWALVREE
jgi:hypothetical protein